MVQYIAFGDESYLKDHKHVVVVSLLIDVRNVSNLERELNTVKESYNLNKLDQTAMNALKNNYGSGVTVKEVREKINETVAKILKKYEVKIIVILSMDEGTLQNTLKKGIELLLERIHLQTNPDKLTLIFYDEIKQEKKIINESISKPTILPAFFKYNRCKFLFADDEMFNILQVTSLVAGAFNQAFKNFLAEGHHLYEINDDGDVLNLCNLFYGVKNYIPLLVKRNDKILGYGVKIK